MRSKMSTIGTSDSAFHDGNPSTGELGTIVTADWLNAVQASTMDLQDELLNVLAAASIANDPAVKTQILAAINKLSKLNMQSGSATFATDTGAANAYVVSLTPALASPRGEGMVIRFKVANTNTGACTVNDGVSIQPLVGLALSALQGGEMVAGGYAWVQWHPNVGTGSYVLLFCSGASLQIPAGTKPGHAINNSQVTGAVAHFAMTTPPVGWLKANGAAISRTAYAALFAAIGTSFGVGDGATTFNVPDLRGEFLRGFDDARGIDASRAFASSQDGTWVRTVVQEWSGSDIASGTFDIGFAYAQSDAEISTIWPTQTVPTGAKTPAGSTYNPSTVDNTIVGAVSVDDANSINHWIKMRPRNVALLACIKY